MIRAVVIDFDDTLCMTEAASFDLENEALRRMGRTPMSRAVHLSTWGQPVLTAIMERSPGVDVDQFEAEFHRVRRRYVHDGRLDSIPAENLHALDQLVAAGRMAMLLTSRSEAETSHLRASGHALRSRISAVYHAGNTRFRKPDPRAFDELLATNRLTPDECIYAGDSPGDAEAAFGAGLGFIACLQSGVRRRADFQGRHVGAYIDCFPQVVRAVAEMEASAASGRLVKARLRRDQLPRST